MGGRWWVAGSVVGGPAAARGVDGGGSGSGSGSVGRGAAAAQGLGRLLLLLLLLGGRRRRLVHLVRQRGVHRCVVAGLGDDDVGLATVGGRDVQKWSTDVEFSMGAAERGALVRGHPLLHV